MRARMQAIAVLSVLATLAGACGGGANATQEGETTINEQAATGDPVVIGSSLPLTGALEAFGTSLRTGYTQAVDEINAAGGLDVGGTARPVELVIQDNKTNPDLASQQARSLVLDDGAVALLGPATPPLSIPVSVVAEQLETPAVITITPIRAWQGANEEGWTWSWDIFFDELQMTETQFLAADLVDTNQKVALFTDLEEDGVVMGGLWEEKAPDLGYEIVYRAEFPVDATNLASQVAEAMAADADIVIAQVIPPTGLALLREMDSAGYVPQLVFIEKAGNTGGWTAISEGLGEGTLAANWFARGMGTPREEEFISTYAEELGGVDSNLGVIVYGYTAASVLLDAITAAGSTDATAVNDAIAATSGEYPAGTVAFDDGHASPLPVVQTQWQGSDMVLVMHPDGSPGPGELITPNAGLSD